MRFCIVGCIICSWSFNDEGLWLLPWETFTTKVSIGWCLLVEGSAQVQVPGRWRKFDEKLEKTDKVQQLRKKSKALISSSISVQSSWISKYSNDFFTSCEKWYDAAPAAQLTCVLESGRAQERTPERRNSAIFWLSRWARTTVNGMHSSVSSVAYPNIRP